MSSSRVVLIGGIAVMFGFYAYVIQQANSKIVDTGQDKMYRTQARLIGNVAINVAANYLNSPYSGGQAVSNRSCYGGTFSYTVTYLSADDARVEASATFGGITTSQVALLTKVFSSTKPGKKKWSQWAVKQVYTSPT